MIINQGNGYAFTCLLSLVNFRIQLELVLKVRLNRDIYYWFFSFVSPVSEWERKIKETKIINKNIK